MADTNKSLHLKNLARDADAANPYQDWGPPTMARAARSASSPARPADAEEGGDRLDQIDKAFSPTGAGGPFSADDIFATEESNPVDPFLAYTRQKDRQDTGPARNQSAATAPAPESASVFVQEQETDRGAADAVFAEPDSGASADEERASQPFADFSAPPVQEEEEGQFESADEGDGDRGEDRLTQAEDAAVEPADAAPAPAAPTARDVPDEALSPSPAQLSVAAQFSEPAQFMRSPPDPGSAPPELQHPEAAAANLTLKVDPTAAEDSPAAPGADESDSETAAAMESGHGYEPLSAAGPGGLHIEPMPEQQLLSDPDVGESADDDENEPGPRDEIVRTHQEEFDDADAFAHGGDGVLSVDFSEELDTLRTQVDSLITSYTQIQKENFDLKRQCAEAEENAHRHAEDSKRLRGENEQLQPLRVLNRELQEEVADAQREKRHYQGMVRNIRDKNREAASAMHNMIVRLGDIEPSS